LLILASFSACCTFRALLLHFYFIKYNAGTEISLGGQIVPPEVNVAEWLFRPFIED